jgi:hypothetical protein
MTGSGAIDYSALETSQLFVKQRVQPPPSPHVHEPSGTAGEKSLKHREFIVDSKFFPPQSRSRVTGQAHIHIFPLLFRVFFATSS